MFFDRHSVRSEESGRTEILRLFNPQNDNIIHILERIW